MMHPPTLEGLQSSLIEELSALPTDTTLYAEEIQSVENDRSSPYTQEEYECILRGKELQQVEAIIAAREIYADKVFKLLLIWLIVVGIIVFLQGFCPKFVLSDNVLMTLIGGTTLNVIGIFTIVANFLFPKNGHSFFSRESPRKKNKIKSKLKTDKIDTNLG